MVCGTRTTRELMWEQANMGWFLRVGNLIVAKMIQVLYDGPSLTDCGCTLRLTHRRGADRHPRRSDRWRVALPARNGHPRVAARPQDHRGAGELPRPGRRIEDHRHAARHAANRLPDDRADPAAPTVLMAPATRAVLIVVSRCNASVSVDGRRLLRPGRLRRRLAAVAEAGLIVPGLVRQHLDGRHLGLHAGRDSSISSRHLPGGGMVGRRVAGRQSRHQHRVSMRATRCSSSESRVVAAGLTLPAATLCGRRVRTAAGAGGNGRVGHRTRRFDAGVLLYLRAFLAVRPVACIGQNALVLRGGDVVLRRAVQQAEHGDPWPRLADVRHRDAPPAAAGVVGMAASVCDLLRRSRPDFCCFATRCSGRSRARASSPWRPCGIFRRS